VKLSTYLQISGCELHKNAFGFSRTRCTGELYSAPPDPLVVIRGREGGKGKERIGNREGEGREGLEGVGRDWKGEGGSGRGKEGTTAPEFLVTPLAPWSVRLDVAHTGEPAKTAEPIKMLFEGARLVRRYKKTTIIQGRMLVTLTNTTERSVNGGDASLCQITLTNRSLSVSALKHVSVLTNLKLFLSFCKVNCLLIVKIVPCVHN